jgi:hypothetical protein
LQVLCNHLLHQNIKTELGLPAQLGTGLAGIAHERLHFRWAEVPRIHLYNDVARLAIDALLIYALAAPFNVDAELSADGSNELTH